MCQLPIAPGCRGAKHLILPLVFCPPVFSDFNVQIAKSVEDQSFGLKYHRFTPFFGIL